MRKRTKGGGREERTNELSWKGGEAVWSILWWPVPLPLILVSGSFSSSHHRLSHPSVPGTTENTHTTHEEYYVRSLSHTKAWFVLLDLKLVYLLALRCVRLVYYQSEMEAKKLGNPKGMRTLPSWKIRRPSCVYTGLYLPLGCRVH